MITTEVRKLIIRLGYYSKPDFLIVGAQKSGTTSLFSILKQHSRIIGAYKKEIHFFDDDEQYAANAYYKYHQHFPLPHKVKKNQLTFEATPSYLYHPEVAKRIKLYNPNIKLIIILRNPAQRALSAWSMYHYQAEQHEKYFYMHDKRLFREAIEEELVKIDKVNWYNDKYSYVKRGIYYPQVKQYLDIFSPEQVLIIEHRELKNEHDKTIKKISDFLSIPSEALTQQYLLQNTVSNQNDYPEELNRLNEFYRPYNKLLFDLIGKSYNW